MTGPSAGCAAVWNEKGDESVVSSGKTGMKILDLNHVAIHSADVEASRQFYEEGLGLVPKARPAFDFPGAWFDLGGGRELHLLGGMDFSVVSHCRGAHFALQVASLDEVQAELEEKGIPVVQGPQTRPDGARQIFVTDPDGYWVEFCELR
ncbi:MAG: VOC family protein [Verrucomicrobiota bacterium]